VFEPVAVNVKGVPGQDAEELSEIDTAGVTKEATSNPILFELTVLLETQDSLLVIKQETVSPDCKLLEVKLDPLAPADTPLINQL
jgi:hypothetical protein